MSKFTILDLSGTLTEDLLGQDASSVQILRSNGTSKEETLKHIAGMDGVLLASMGRIDQEVIDSAKSLKVIGRVGTGFQNVDVQHATRNKIRVVYSGTANSETVADLAFGLLLSVARNITISNHEMRLTHDDIWDMKTGDRYSGVDVSHKTLGVIGYGRIGKCMARRARGFDMPVLVHDPFVDVVSDDAIKACSKQELLSQADFVTVHVPYSEKTANFIDTDDIAIMKKSAIVINAAYGGIVNEESLYRALKEGRLGGAGIDTPQGKVGEMRFDPKKELYRLNNVVVTPILGGKTVECGPRSVRVVYEQMARVLKGQKPEFAHNAL